MKLRFIAFFALLAIVVGLVVSYVPPAHNAEAIWSLVGFALGHFAKYLSPDKATDPAPTVQPPSTPAAPTQPAPGPSP